MSADERSLLWQHIEALRQTMADLVTVQRAALAALPPAVGADSLAPVLSQLAAMGERLDAQREEIAQHAARVAADEPVHFTEITTERVNVVEPDGTLRLAIANRERMASPVVDRKVGRKRTVEAGIIFFNDEGDECGGLAFHGKRDGDRYSADGILAFDQFKQDQVVFMFHDDRDGKRQAGFGVTDRPDMPMPEFWERWQALQQLPDGPEKREALAGMRAETNRIIVGKDVDRSAYVCLFDTRGRPRAKLSVSADGTPRLEFLDESGQVTDIFPTPRLRLGQ